MPQGSWTTRHGARWGVACAAGRALRPALAVSALALLAACAQTESQPQTTPRVATEGTYNRPASYDPPGPSHDPWGPWIREASRRFDVPERWVREVMRQESGGRVGATSPVGAMGLMQVMPGTYRELQARYGLGADPYHPYDSIMAGTAYLREMYELYGSPAFLAAYNAGPRRLEDYLWNNRGLPAETRNYVARIGPRIAGASPGRRAPPEVYAAAEIPLNIPAGPRRMDSATMLALREQRNATNPGIQVAQLPAGPVVRMEPIPDGTTTGSLLAAAAPAPAPYQVAAIGGPVVRMDPIPDGATEEGAARLAESASRGFAAPVTARQPVAESPLMAPPPVVAMPAPATPAAAPRQPASVALAAAAQPALRLAAPPVFTPATAPAPRPAATNTQLASAVPAGVGAGRSFGLIGSAHASTLPAGLRPVLAAPTAAATPAVAPAAAGAIGGWGVQVGAFANEAMARNAAGTARGASGVASSRVAVQRVAQGRNTLYRARVTGLSQSSAQALCDRLRSRGACFVLSPDSQS